MKIENVQSVKNIPDKLQPQFLKQGEFFVSEVLEVRGDTAILKSAQGTLLTARLLGNLGLASGDYVETVVDEAHGNRYVLRLLDVSRGDGKPAAPGNMTTTAETGVQNARVQMLHGMLAMLKKNAGLEPKMAELMARNGIADTPENIETLARLVKGELKTGQVLLQMQGEAARAGTVSANTAAALAQPGVFEASVISHTMPSAANTQTAAASPGIAALDTAAAEQLPIQNSANTNINVTQPQQADAQKAAVVPQSSVQSDQAAEAEVQKIPANTVGIQNGVPEFSVPADGGVAQAARQDIAATNHPITGSKLPGIPAVNDPVIGVKLPGVPAANVSGNGMGLPADVPPPDMLAGQLLSLIVDLKDKKTLPAQLKKAVEELPVQIKELKIALQTADNTDRNTLARQVESLDRQFSLTSELKRFDCYHIPLTGMNREQATAELYVFRQRRRKAEADPETFAVLLGLDTQHMGRVETMIRAAGRSVALEFRLENAELADAFGEGAKALEPLIGQAGYRLTEVNVRELAARTTVLNAEEALSGQAAPDTGSLDIRV